MTQGSYKFATSNAQRSLRHVVSIYRNDRKLFKRWWRNPILHMAVKDNKEISFKREASIDEIHAQSASLWCKDRCDRRDRKFSIPDATTAGKLIKTVSISTLRSLVTNLCDPCVTSDPCDQMETTLYSLEVVAALPDQARSERDFCPKDLVLILNEIS